MTVERQPYDLVILGFDANEHIHVVEEILQAGEHHVLLVPCHDTTPTQALICVASGEPGKDDVLFAGRLIRHLGADAKLLSVLPAGQKQDGLAGKRADRFLAGGVKSLTLLGVPAQTAMRTGPVGEEILNEMQEGSHDLLVIGAPLANEAGSVRLSGVVGQILTSARDHPILIVRSHSWGPRVYAARSSDSLY
jgi:hypothetical protein